MDTHLLAFSCVMTYELLVDGSAAPAFIKLLDASN
jgi:hypothetical protein